jgi:plasmid maintenance system antidote protein VapI
LRRSCGAYRRTADKQRRNISMREPMMKTTMTEDLKNAIAASGKSVASIARGAGIAQPVLNRFVQGKRGLTLSTAEKLAAYLGLELREKLYSRDA